MYLNQLGSEQDFTIKRLFWFVQLHPACFIRNWHILLWMDQRIHFYIFSPNI